MLTCPAAALLRFVGRPKLSTRCPNAPTLLSSISRISATTTRERYTKGETASSPSVRVSRLSDSVPVCERRLKTAAGGAAKLRQLGSVLSVGLAPVKRSVFLRDPASVGGAVQLCRALSEIADHGTGRRSEGKERLTPSGTFSVHPGAASVPSPLSLLDLRF